MAEVDSITIPELQTDVLTADSLIPFSVPGGEMKKATAQALAGILTTTPSPQSDDQIFTI